jgi:hypothetical protein
MISRVGTKTRRVAEKSVNPRATENTEGKANTETESVLETKILSVFVLSLRPLWLCGEFCLPPSC